MSIGIKLSKLIEIAKSEYGVSEEEALVIIKQIIELTENK